MMCVKLTAKAPRKYSFTMAFTRQNLFIEDSYAKRSTPNGVLRNASRYAGAEASNPSGCQSPTARRWGRSIELGLLARHRALTPPPPPAVPRGVERRSPHRVPTVDTDGYGTASVLLAAEQD
ncbi:hypothetical protein Ari01nite_98200 [Paractinoplanes rishiriensis]|uniref:Uncharacterized protein n=1 Tax=Paractinoplanes rishiriensis TaxID=1050105 RepID=A0A919KBB8_9ACTN|nr:hypothetical protein Ari01nite_98200 [Actinoplanes rishiriensis]